MTIGHEMCLLLIEMQYIHQSCRFNDYRKIQMTLVVRQFVYQHVCISDRIQWFGPIILPMTVFVINSHGK